MTRKNLATEEKPRSGPEELRQALGTRQWTQHKIAAELGVSKATVSRWLSGDRVPDRAHMAALRKLLDISPEAWL
jgi:transcriptional regulator with XRE-family HTH domain